MAHKVVVRGRLSVHECLAQPVEYPAVQRIRRQCPGAFPRAVDCEHVRRRAADRPSIRVIYALRTGAGFDITSPYNELIDDQQVVRLAIRQRLQTKFGPPDHQKIRDWMTLDLEASYFPDPGRDNFGVPWGSAHGTLRLEHQPAHVDSRQCNLRLLSTTRPRCGTSGVLSQRSERGSVYLGLQAIKADDGVLDSDIVTASYSYQMSSKWISTMGTAYDFGGTSQRRPVLHVYSRRSRLVVPRRRQLRREHG